MIPLKRSAYLLVYSNPGPGLQFLVGRKNVYGIRVGGQYTPPIVLNNAGQCVIPGGRKGDDEFARDAALREFREETGVDFTNLAVRTVYGVVAGNEGPERWSRRHDIQGGKYTVFYVQVHRSAAQQLLDDIMQNLVLHATADDELMQVEWSVGAQATKQCFGPVEQPWPDGIATQMVDLKPTVQYAEALAKMQDKFEWFRDCVDNCPAVVGPPVPTAAAE